MTTYAYSSDAPGEIRTGLLIVPVFQGPAPGPGVREMGLADAYAGAKLTGKKGEHLLVTARTGDRFAAGAVLLVGVGPKAEFTVDAARRALGRAAGTARRFGTVATTFPTVFSAKQAADAVGASIEGLGLGAYRFDRYRTKKADGKDLRRITAVGPARWEAKPLNAAVKRAATIVEAVSWARDLVNIPAGDMPPAEIAREAQAMAKQVGLTCKIWNEKQLAEGGFNGILGVGKGSVNPPRLIELKYTGAGRATPIALTGKGIAFDSGGLSIKDAKGMESMKDDMGGAASILATMKVIAQLKPKINVIAAIPCSENMPSGSAQKPGDVITHRGGTTSEVLNTDAEGRLVLADALAYLAEKKPQLIIDTATLTGACMVAFGDRISGAFGNDRRPGRRPRRCRRGRRGADVGDAAVQGIPGADRFAGRRHQEHRRPLGRRHHGGLVPGRVRRSHAVGARGHRRTRRSPIARDDLGPRGATGVPVRTLVRFVLDRAGA